MILEDLISNLRVLKQDLPVKTYDSTGVDGFSSYRGIYAHLAIEPGEEPMIVADLLKEAEAAVGQTFEGYKGGDFTMREDSPIWISPYGRATGKALVDVVVKHGDQGQDLAVVLVGHDITDYLF